MVQGSRENIINAVFRIADKNPDKKDITITEIAQEAGISRQAIYQKHFSNVDEIFDYIHQTMTDEVFKTFQESIANPKNQSIYQAVARDIIPLVYQNRDKARIFYHTSIDGSMFDFLEDHYLSLLESSNIEIDNHSPFATKSMVKIIINYIFSIIREWISEDFPEPPEVFAKTFLNLMENSPMSLINAKPKAQNKD